jgi:sigma54-dependent transcription regulator
VVKKKFLAFATSFDALWFENFSDLVGASMRMDALASQ